jgi:chemotaxis protein methyltransferase CheR
MSSIFPPQAVGELINDPLYPRLKDHVVQSTGMAYYADKDAEFSRRLKRRFDAAEVRDCGRYLDLLRHPVQGPPELDALIAEITIGETYFFRHPEHFDALRDHVLPELIARNRHKRSLRVWDAGCADGPEPYSLSILFKRDLADQLEGWDATILGTDINRHSLARAREGAFEDWALRSMPAETRDLYFAGQGKRWAIAPEYKEGVSFQYHNLVEDSFPSLINNLSSFDLIVCRNVMIYFGVGLMGRILHQFHQCLSAGGWLLVGPSEPNMTSFGSFRTVNAPGVTLYQKQEEAARSPEAEWYPVRLSEPVAVATAAKLPETPRRTETLADARTHADRGDWEEAARCCEELLKVDSLNARNHFYYGLVMEQMRNHTQAEASLKRAIYLDRQSVLAHYYFGLFSQSRGDLRRAGRSFQNALDLLRAKNDEVTFPDADGITASELRKLAAMQLDMLGDQA